MDGPRGGGQRSPQTDRARAASIVPCAPPSASSSSSSGSRRRCTGSRASRTDGSGRLRGRPPLATGTAKTASDRRCSIPTRKSSTAVGSSNVVGRSHGHGRGNPRSIDRVHLNSARGRTSPSPSDSRLGFHNPDDGSESYSSKPGRPSARSHSPAFGARPRRRSRRPIPQAHRRYNHGVRLPVRIALLIVGLAVAVYGFVPLLDSSMSPSWWWIPPPPMERPPERSGLSEDEARMTGGTIHRGLQPRSYRESISASIAAVGSVLVTLGALSGRREVAPTRTRRVEDGSRADRAAKARALTLHRPRNASRRRDRLSSELGARTLRSNSVGSVSPSAT